ncbi:MAG: hypothetical protein FJ125_05235 [Deltaproteobacteria bacterium]|nr:hypothetical protein [Deltaproteobacteria bacterium]
MTAIRRLLTIYLPDGPALRKLLEDELERGALFVPTFTPPGLGEQIAVRIQVGEHPQPLELEGRVVHSSKVVDAGSLGPGVGLLVQGAARVILSTRRLLQELEEPGAAAAFPATLPEIAAATSPPPAAATRPAIAPARAASTAPRPAAATAPGRPASTASRPATATCPATVPEIAAATVRPPAMTRRMAATTSGARPGGSPGQAQPTLPPPGAPAGSAVSRPAGLQAAAGPAPQQQLPQQTPHQVPPAPSRGSQPAQAAARTAAAAAAEATAMEERLRTYRELLESDADHYRLLRVKRNATVEQIRRAFFGLARDFHPDAHFRRASPEVVAELESIYQKIGEAYHALSAAERRIQYDRTLAQTAAAAPGEEEASAVPGQQGSAAGDLPERLRERQEGRMGRVKALFEKAQAAHLAGDPIGAQSTLRLVLSHDPLHREARELLQTIEEGTSPPRHELARRPAPSRPAADHEPLDVWDDPVERGRARSRANMQKISAEDVLAWMKSEENAAPSRPRPAVPERAATAERARPPAQEAGDKPLLGRLNMLVQQARQALAEEDPSSPKRKGKRYRP